MRKEKLILGSDGLTIFDNFMSQFSAKNLKKEDEIQD